MIDAINRTELKENIAKQRKAWLKISDNKEHLMRSVEHCIDKAPRLENMDCTECLMTTPKRMWQKANKIKPTPLTDVLIKHESGWVHIGQYNNGGWLLKVNDDEYFFTKEKVIEWKQID